ncbi:hypothetical protein PybrP1_008931 [[Pythium] brassicae (nom. inval.)]|nr:hypothetical protein PybrP1_008931 [[Pythium] brassicae (nom. inval.)]
MRKATSAPTSAAAPPRAQISQETFDDVVRENMEEFDMELEEATRDAVQQFESQRVDLSNIIKQVGGGASADERPAAVLEQLKRSIAALRALSGSGRSEDGDTDADAVLAQLAQLQEVCDRFPEAKVVAGRNDAIDTLLDVVDASARANNSAALERASALLAFLCADSPDNQDFVGPVGMARLAGALSADSPAVVRVLQAVRAACAKHEANKAHFAKAQGLPAVCALLPSAQQSDALSQHVARVLRVLTVNDDPRAAFSQAHETIKALVAKDALVYVLDTVQRAAAAGAPELLAAWLAVLRQLAVTEEHCTQIFELQGLALLQQVMAKHEGDRAVTTRCVTVLRNVAAADALKAQLLASGAVERVLAAMQQHAGDAALQQHACATLAAIALRAPDHSVRVVALGGARQIARAMRTHSGDAALLRQASLALRNLGARSVALRPRILDEGVEPLLRAAVQRRGCGDEAYAALRDLGCAIQLAAFGPGTGSRAQFNPVHVESSKLLARVEDAAEAPFAS